MESTLSSQWSRYDPPLSHQGAALAHLDSLLPNDLVLWTDSSVPFLFGKGCSGVLANCSLCGTEATLSFLAGPVCSSFSAEACAILHALCWSWQHQQVCHFSSPPVWLSFCPHHPVLSSIFPLISKSVADLPGAVCFYLLLLSDYNGSPDTRFSRGTTRLMSWPDEEHYLCPLLSLVVSLLLSLTSTLVLSQTGGILSHQNSFDTQVSLISTEELVLPCHVCCVLSRLRCNIHSLLLGSYLSRIGRIKNPSCRACGHLSQDTSHLILHCPAMDSLRHSLFGDSLSLYLSTTSGPDPEELLSFWGSMVIHHAPIPRKGSGK